MKKKYRCNSVSRGKWVVTEVPTEQVVAKGAETQMRYLAAKLNSGGGFNGNTPAFLLYEFL